MRTRETRDESPVKPQVVARHVNDLLADDAIITTDSGTITTWAARHIHIRRGMMFSCSGNLATMAPGLPYAIGAQAAYPDRQVVAFVGDGGFTMLMGEFVTAVKHDLPIKVVIIKNNTLGQIKWEQMVFLGNPEYEVDAAPDRLREVRRGVRRRRDSVASSPRRCGPPWRRRSPRKKPAIVEAVVDPFEPPMPAQATPQQALQSRRVAGPGRAGWRQDHHVHLQGQDEGTGRERSGRPACRINVSVLVTGAFVAA